nr:nucleotide-binding alpha-beta plait domain-containing protein [Tanacetum cinerariifolium]
SFSAKDLFHSCKQYGHVVDSFIPLKKTKDGKRFGFVRFINVFNVDRLVNNLCTIWVGRMKFHANVARFKRESKMGRGYEGRTENVVSNKQIFSTSKDATSIGNGKSFVVVVKNRSMALETKFTPSIVLDDDCMNKKDLSLSLMWKVKEMASLANLKRVLCNEGFDTLNIIYLGELWVLLEFKSSKIKELFRHNAGAGSWFSVLQQADADFVPDGRLGELLDVDDYDELNLHSKRICILFKVRQNIHESFKVVFRGKVHWVHAIEVPGWTPKFNVEEEDDISVEGNFDAKPEAQEANNVFDESDVEEVLETEFDVPSGKKDNQSEDPFGLYPLLRKDNLNMARKVNEEVHSLSHPSGFTPKGDLFEGGTILNLKEEVVKVGQTMGYNMEGCIKDITEIIDPRENLGLFDEFLSLNETKMKLMDLNTLRSCWGNSNFEYVHSDSVGNSGGILCIWDPNSFRRNSYTRLDYFVIIRGVWLKSGIDLLNVVVYAPQEAKEKLMLYWLEVDGFDKMVRDSWEDAPGNKDNAIRNFIEELEQMITKEEVKSAVWDYGVDKSSGPDGFSFSFYHHFWPMIEEDVFGAVEYFFIHGDMPKGCNSNFIALIPKVLDANMVKDFRLISLIGSLYKIIAKVLANRLVGVLSDLINEVQYAFVADRQILDGPFILNEVHHWCRKKKKHVLIFKVDFEKAYDSVRWDFLDDVSLTEEFQFFRDINQGDPLSPFLFILFMESLHISFQRVVDVGLFTGINSVPWASGLRINMCKSKIRGVNVEDAKVKTTAIKLGCLVLKTPFTYLGTKVGDNMSRKHAWNEVEEKVISRLSRWKMKTLSIGGRFTLLKSILGSMPIFHMSIFKVPSSILKNLEAIRSHFFNGQVPKSKNASWVKWSQVLTSKEKGGLGVSSLYALNRGLMFKWLWQFYSQKHSLWTKVIKAIYGEDRSFDKAGFFGGRTCGVLKRLFPRVYALELNKNISVSLKFNAPRLDTSFRRIARSGIEETQFNSMVEIVKATSLMPCDDRYTWLLGNDGTFSVASIRKVIDGNRFQEVSLSTRWVKSVPIKVNILAWKVKSNALPTRFNISRHGMDIDSIDYPICNMGVETTSHVFFQCKVVRQIMRKISSWWNMDYLEVDSYEDWRAWLVSTRIHSSLKGIIEGIYYGLWWVMWNFRNKLLFDTKTPEKALIFDSLVSTSFYWFKYRCKASFKWDDWLLILFVVDLAPC